MVPFVHASPQPKRHLEGPLKIAPFHGDLDPIFEPTRAHNQKGISTGSVVFAWLTIVTDSQTDRQTSLLGL